MQLPPPTPSLFHSPLPRSHEWLFARPNLSAPERLPDDADRTGNPHGGRTLTRSCRTFGWEGGLIVTLVGLLLCCDSTCSVGVPSACTSEKVNPPLGGRTPAHAVCTRQKTKQRGAPVVTSWKAKEAFIYVATVSIYDDSGTKPPYGLFMVGRFFFCLLQLSFWCLEDRRTAWLIFN